MSKYFTPITELPGDSGKSESAAGMVRYKRSTSDNNKFSKSLPSSTKFVSSQKMFPTSTKQSVPNSGKFLKHGKLLRKSETIPQIILRLATEVINGSKNIFDFADELFTAGVPIAQIKAEIGGLPLKIFGAGKAVPKTMSNDIDRAYTYLTGIDKGNTGKKALQDIIDASKTTASPFGTSPYEGGSMPSTVKDAFQGLGEAWDARPSYLGGSKPLGTLKDAEQAREIVAQDFAQSMGLDPNNEDNRRNVHEMMEIARKGSKNPVNFLLGGLPIDPNDKLIREYIKADKKVQLHNDYASTYTGAAEQAVQSAKRIGLGALATVGGLGTIGTLGYLGYKKFVEPLFDPLNQNDSLNPKNNYTPPIDNTIKPVQPDSSNPFKDLGGGMQGNKLKRGRLQKGDTWVELGRAAVKSLEEGWRVMLEMYVKEFHMPVVDATATVNSYKKLYADNKFSFIDLKNELSKMAGIIEKKTQALNPKITTTIAPVIDKELEKMKDQIFEFKNLQNPELSRQGKVIARNYFNGMSKAEIESLHSELKASTPAFAQFVRSAENSLKTLRGLPNKLKGMNNPIDEAQRLTDVMRQKQYLTGKDAPLFPTPTYDIEYAPSKIINPNAKGLDFLAQSFADIQVNPQRVWSKNLINATGLGAVAGGLYGVYNAYTQPDPPPPPYAPHGGYNGTAIANELLETSDPATRTINEIKRKSLYPNTKVEATTKDLPLINSAVDYANSHDSLNSKLDSDHLKQMGIDASYINPEMLRYISNQLNTENLDNPLSENRRNDWKQYSQLSQTDLKNILGTIKRGVDLTNTSQSYIEPKKRFLDDAVTFLATKNNVKNTIPFVNGEIKGRMPDWNRDITTGDEKNFLGTSYNNAIVNNLLDKLPFDIAPKNNYSVPKYLAYPKITDKKDVPQSSTNSYVPPIEKNTKKRASSVKKADEPWSRNAFYNNPPRKLHTPDYVTSTTNTRWDSMSDKEKGRMAATQAFQEAEKKYKNTSDVVQHTIQRAGEIARNIGFGAVGIAGKLAQDSISGVNDLKRKTKSTVNFANGVAEVINEKNGVDAKEQMRRAKSFENVISNVENAKSNFRSGVKSTANNAMHNAIDFSHNMAEQSKPVIRNMINQAKPVVQNFVRQVQPELAHLANNASHVSQEVISGITNWLQDNPTSGKTTKRQIGKSMHFQKSMTTSTSITQPLPSIQKHNNKYMKEK